MAGPPTHGPSESPCTACSSAGTLSSEKPCRRPTTRWAAAGKSLPVTAAAWLFHRTVGSDELLGDFTSQIVNDPLLIPEGVSPLLRDLVEGLLCKGQCPPPPPGLLDSPRWRLSLSSNRGLSRRSQAAVDPESGGGAPVGRHGRRAGDGDRRGGGSRPAVKRGVRGDLRRAGEDGVWGFISSVVSWWLTLICRGYELESQRLQNGWGRSDSLCRQVFIYLPALIWERERELETRNR